MGKGRQVKRWEKESKKKRKNKATDNIEEEWNEQQQKKKIDEKWQAFRFHVQIDGRRA